jgi:hypothetical protein
MSKEEWNRADKEFQMNWNSEKCLRTLCGNYAAVALSYWYNHNGLQMLALEEVANNRLEFTYISFGTL